MRDPLHKISEPTKGATLFTFEILRKVCAGSMGLGFQGP